MDSLKFESNPGKQTALSLLGIVVGVTLVIAYRHFDGPGMTNSLAGFLSGLLLLFIGVSAFLAGGKQSIFVDPQSRCIVVEDTNRFRTKKRSIPFGNNVDTGIGYLGSKSNHVSFYYIILKLKNGEQYSLFSPGRFFDGGSDRSVMENRRQRLEEFLDQYAGQPGIQA